MGCLSSKCLVSETVDTGSTCTASAGSVLWRLAAAIDIVDAVRRQLPDVIREHVTLDVRSDPFHVSTRVRFSFPARDGARDIECDLEPRRDGNRVVSVNVPDNIMARLCVEVWCN
jgi:hypothetical protein